MILPPVFSTYCPLQQEAAYEFNAHLDKGFDDNFSQVTTQRAAQKSGIRWEAGRAHLVFCNFSEHLVFCLRFRACRNTCHSWQLQISLWQQETIGSIPHFTQSGFLWVVWFSIFFHFGANMEENKALHREIQILKLTSFTYRTTKQHTQSRLAKHTW